MKGIFAEIKISRKKFLRRPLIFALWNSEYSERLFSKKFFEEAEVVRARFYHGAKIRLSLIFALVVILLGSAFPKPCWSANAANFPLATFGNSALFGVVGSREKFEKIFAAYLAKALSTMG